ncbi:molybdopterin-binding protein [Herbiconiux sp. YIM B11900]|uniref:molybdopterin-binding protein n=1 Tax=Herbiconiux sp. YIM B11900 TaxID=3404131 RepID=UPI003F85D03E
MSGADRATGPDPAAAPRPGSASEPEAASASGPASATTASGELPAAAPVPWHEARRIARAAAVSLEPIRVPLEAAAGRVLAGDLHALLEVPHYDSSAMDGWAVAGDPPWRVLDDDSNPVTLRGGEARPIVTGGLVPGGIRGVLRSEHGVVRSVDGLRMLEPRPGAAGEPHPGQHIRLAGREARKGERLIGAGRPLNPVHLALAAAGGHDHLAVAARPAVAVLLTGAEVVPQGIPGPGRVRDSFGPSLPGVIASLGGTVTGLDRIGDDLDATITAIAAITARATANPAPSDSAPPAGAAPSLLLTTGGTGGSGSDHVRAALRALGAEFLVDGLAARPGGPALLARLPGGLLVVGLPGNPLAALLSLLTLAHPVLAAFQGLPLPALGEVVLGAAVEAARSPTVLRPYRLHDGLAVPTDWHGSGMLRGLADADGVLVCEGAGAAAGERVPTLPIPW